MPKYIKSHSNYRLSTKHQLVKNGTVLERDISTVGGVNSFATGQSTIYSSGNFVMTINNTTSASRHIVKKGWLANSESGNTWNAQVLQNYTSDINGSVESRISLNNDFMDLRSFACYGSLYNLIQTSVSEIIEKFPYELYTGTGSENYQKHYLNAEIDASSFDFSGQTSSNGYNVSTNFFELSDSGTPVTYVSGFEAYMYEVSNPGNIDLHTTVVDINVINNPLKFFANGGFQNYAIFSDKTTENPIDGYSIEWEVESNVEKVSTLGITITSETFHVPNFVLSIQEDLNINSITFNSVLYESAIFNGKEYTLKDIFVKSGDILYGRVKNSKLELSQKYCPEEGDYVATVTLTVKLEDGNHQIKLYAFRNENLNVAYLVEEEDLFLHIKPKPSLCAYEEFIDNSSLFERCLLGVYSGDKNVAKFEIINEAENGTYKSTEHFTFPIGDGGYNLATNDSSIERYIQSLAKIGLIYDEKYTDNMYRVMTHESLKNFDWTKDFNGNGGDLDNNYITNGEKFKSIIRIMGYVFDREKTYIDCIGNTNIITYNNRSNLSEYFFTDALELDGWDVSTIYPYELKEYSKKTGNEIHPVDWSDINQKNNYYHRKFFENTTEIITPYTLDEGGFYMGCNASGTSEMYEVPNYSGQTYYIDGDVVKNVIKDYVRDTEYTIPDINNEFMRRLKINSRSILAKKGTIEGIESLLSLFGFRSKRWFDALDTERTKYKIKDKLGKNLTKKIPFDFDIVEYTMFTPPIKEGWDEARNMYKIDFYNSCKTIPYNTQSYINGEYIPYQGIPVAYRDINGLWITPSGETTNKADAYTDNNYNPVKARRLYPYFDRLGVYDGDMYYQMNGGWLNYWPYSFDTNNGIIPNYNSSICKETLRSIRQVRNIKELVSQPVSELYDDMIFYVADTKTNYAIIDGEIYELYDEFVGTDHYRYFKIPIYGAAISVGGELYSDYIKVSDKNSESGTSLYDLSLYNDGVEIKIYYNTIEKPFIIQKINSLIDETIVLEPNETEVFINGSLYSDYENYTNYFKLNNAYFSDKISNFGWSQLKKTDENYLRINSIVDNFKGNNPHTGNLNYDNGHEYLSRFDRLFKYASDNSMFDESCFFDVDEAYEDINSIGFSGLVDTFGYSLDYTTYQHPDSKIHSFADKLSSGGTIENYDLTSPNWIKSIPDYEFVKDISEADGVTSQIMNTKVVDLKFYLSNEEFFSKECQEEIKFIQDKVMPYVEQMLPSSAIVKVKLFPATLNWVFNKNDNDTTDLGKVDRWKDYYFWREEAKLGEQFNDYNAHLQ